MLTNDEIAERMEWIGVPARFRACRFSTFDAYTPILQQKLTSLEQTVGDRRGAFIFGQFGTGKTHLAVAMLAEYISLGSRCRFVGALEYVNAVQLDFGNPKKYVDENFQDRKTIALDDLGAQRESEAARAAMFYLVDQLYSENKRIIVTSNFSPTEILKWEPRIMSRLTEMCALVEIDAEDYRLKTAAKRAKLMRTKPGVIETVQ
jgi:DNA replication protein DnaC